MKTAEDIYHAFVQYERNPISHRVEESILDAMVEFAKIHVTEALKQASESIIGLEYSDILSESILNAYPLSNIK